MNILIYIIIVVLSLEVFAGKKDKQRHHEAHVHGNASLNIAFDQLKGKIEFKTASQSILGFEHEAKTEVDLKKLNKSITDFDSEIDSMIQFDKSLGCHFTKESIEIIEDKEIEKKGDKKHNKLRSVHSDFIAHYLVDCKMDIKGSNVTVDFSKYKELNEIEMTLLISDLQKSVKLNGKPITIELK